MSARITNPTVFALYCVPPRLLVRRIMNGVYRYVDDALERRCETCREYFPADNTAFYASKKEDDGLYHRCKACYLEWRDSWASRKGSKNRYVMNTAPALEGQWK